MSPLRSLLRIRDGRRGRLTRAVAGCWLLLQALVVALAPVADARADAGERGVAHWEDGSSRNCPRIHNPDGCLLCQVIGGGARVGRQAALPLQIAGAEHSGAASTVQRPVAIASDGGPSPRGPPIG